MRIIANFLARRLVRFGAILPIFAFASGGSIHASPRPYCGVNSVYGAAKVLGLDANLEVLIDPKFISSNLGSTSEDIVEAAEEVGMKAIPLSNLGVRSLEHAEYPLILHVSPMGTRGTYEHWLLFLGMERSGIVRIVDGPGGIVQVPVEDVLARWDGNAVAVYPPQSSPTTYWSIELAGLASHITTGIILVLGLGACLSYRKVDDSSKIWIGVLSISVVAGACGLFASVHEGRIYSLRRATLGIDSALGLLPVQELNREIVLKKLQGNTQPVVIDCRSSEDFKAGHIPSAINLPIEIGLGEFKSIVKKISNDVEIVVYCQSENCHMSDYTINSLAGEGFDKLAVYRAGYVDWNGEISTQD